jgi:hypothetical protein
MCGKAFGLPANRVLDFGLCPLCWGGAPDHYERNGSAERFRTSGGIAESRESLFRQSRLDSVLQCVFVEVHVSLGELHPGGYSLPTHRDFAKDPEKSKLEHYSGDARLIAGCMPGILFRERERRRLWLSGGTIV